MTVLDAYAVIAYLRAEPAAAEVRPLLTAGSARLTAVGVAEVLDHLVRLAGADEESAALDLAQLDLLDGIAVDADLGLAAGRLRARRYHRSRCAVSMADCIAAEAARHASAGLATSDPRLLDLCHAEDISTTVLTASDGTRWTPPDRSPPPAPRRAYRTSTGSLSTSPGTITTRRTTTPPTVSTRPGS